MKTDVNGSGSAGESGGTTSEATHDQPAPGGKVLLRLLHVLEREGLQEVAAEAITGAAPTAEQQAALEPTLQRTTASPTGTTAPPAPARPADEETGDARTAAPDEGAGEGSGEGTGEGSGGAPAEAQELAQAYLDAFQSMGPPTATGPQWRSLGPWTIPGGQTYGSSRVNVSGRLSSVAVDPSNGAHVLVGGAQGGIWESFDRGASWAPRTDYQATLTVGAVVFDPSDPRTVYCGTGEGDFYSWLGAGLLRSTDGGRSWATLCTAPFMGTGFYDLVVNRGNRSHLLAGTTTGLYTSTDGGVTWTRRRGARTWSVVMAPAGGASAEILTAASDGVFRSTNGGASWTAVALPGSPGSFDRLEVAIAPSSPGIAYVWGARGSTAYLWRRASGVWSAVAPPPGVNVGQAWYDWFLGVAPDNADQIYCGAIEVHRGDRSGTSWTWRNLSNKGTSGQSIHPDQHGIAFEPGRPDTLYIANDGGLFRSPDRGIGWVHCNNGLVVSEFEYLSQDYGSSRWLLGGTQDNGTQRWTGSSTWTHVADGDGGDCGVNRADPRTVFHTYYGMNPEVSTTRGDFGTWSFVPPSLPAGEGSLFYPPFECSASTGNTIAIGGDSLFLSRNNGGSWTRLAFPTARRASALYIPGPNTVYVGTTTGAILRTTWNGASWTALTALTTPRANAYVSDLHVSATGTRIWATSTTIGGGRVFRSDDRGTTWRDVTPGLPGIPMNAIEVDPANASRAWVAADVGVYQTFDAGATWSAFSASLPNALVGDILFHPHARVLRAGTRNRGVWEIPVDGWQTQPQCGVQFTGDLAGNASGRWFTFSWPATWHVLWTVMPVTVRPGSPQVSWTTQVERANAEYLTYWITVRNLTPDPVRFEGRFAILSRY